jgi:hypothetical protein
LNPRSQRPKKLHALDRAATVTSSNANLLDGNADTIKIYAESVIDASKHVGLGVITEN